MTELGLVSRVVHDGGSGAARLAALDEGECLADKARCPGAEEQCVSRGEIREV